MPQALEDWVNGCLNYQPTKHPDDALMASFFALSQAREWGLLTGAALAQSMEGNLGAAIMAR
jgi:hypothetical protein